MVQYICYSCNQVVQIPRETDNAVIGCGKCGQCLQVPLPWINVPHEPLPVNQAAENEKAPSRKPEDSNAWLFVGLALTTLFAGVVFIFKPDVYILLVAVIADLLILFLLVTTMIDKYLRRIAVILKLPQDPSQEIYQLGIPYAVYQTSRFSTIKLAVLGLLICCAEIVGSHAILHGHAHHFMGDFAALGLGGAWILILAVRYYCICTQVVVFPDGFVCIKGNKTDICRWDQIKAVWKNVTEAYEHGRCPIYKVCRDDKKQWTFDIFQLDNVQTLGDVIEEQVCCWMLPRAIGAYDSGALIEFGQLSLSRNGIGKDEKTLPWDEIVEAQTNRGYFSVQKKGNWRRWCKVPISKIPNFQVFLKLVEKNVKVSVVG